MILLFDIGNTNTHLGLADSRRVRKRGSLPTADWFGRAAGQFLGKFVGGKELEGAALCSVVPQSTVLVRRAVRKLWNLTCLELRPDTVCGIRLVYPKPKTIGPDRLANAIAARYHFGAPVVAVDFGTAVTFDVVDQGGNYLGGIIAPGLAAMTDYLHEKTALLPQIKIRDIDHSIGRSTSEAMLIGAVHGYPGLVRELIQRLRHELKARRLPVVATGGYARLIASNLPEITSVDPLLTLEGVRLVWEASAVRGSSARKRERGRGRSQ